MLRLFTLLFFFYILFACVGQEIKELEIVQLEDKAGIERASNIELLYSDSAFVRVRLTAPTMLRFDDEYSPKQTFPNGIKADFYDEQKIHTSKLIAKYAEQYTKQQKVYLSDSVHIWNNKREHLEAEELTWDEAKRRIYSDKFVKITTPTRIIQGYGLKSNLEFTEWELDSVSGVLESKNIIDSPF